MRTGSWSRLPRIDQRKQDAAGLRAAIDPRVIAGLLDDDIAGLATVRSCAHRIRADHFKAERTSQAPAKLVQ